MLRDYQLDISQRGVAILKQYGLLYLAMQVRTGKTLTSLHIANECGARQVLFLTKKKAIGSIHRDFTALNPSFDLFLTNYEQLDNIAGSFDFVILDEAHSLGQYPKPAAKIAALKKLCDEKPVIYLSGTPTPESYSQLFHQLHISCCSPFREYKNFYAWAKDYVNVKQRRFSHGLINDYSHANKEKIDAATRHLFITYSQEEAGFSAMVQEHILHVKMQPGTYWLANKLRTKRVHIGRGGEELIADTEVKLQQKLHQVFSGTVLCENGEAMLFDNSKALFIREHFKGQKIAVFYKFRAEYIMLKAYLPNVTESPEEFNNSTDKIFCSQIQSGREGINLSTADALVFFNIDFSAVSYWQARARLQTKDRSEAANLYWIFSESGIEAKVYEAVKNKQDYTLNYFRRDYLIEPNKKVA